MPVALTCPVPYVPSADMSPQCVPSADMSTSLVSLALTCPRPCVPSVDMSTSLVSPALQEVCEREAFKAECADDEVVVVRRARYGRMKESRCITTAYGVIGCSVDVLFDLDDACSGRPACDAKVASLIPESVQPCPSDFRSYLEVAYECVEGT